MALQKKHSDLHFVLVPLGSPGHFIPMIDMAKLLARQGVTVTIVTTPLLAGRFASTVGRAVDSGLAIRLRQLRFPSTEAGLPEGCESADMIPSVDLLRNFFCAIWMLQQPFEQMFQELNPSPSCIIADKNFAWLAEVAKKFNVPRFSFDGMSCFTFLCTHNLTVSKVYETVPETQPFVVPGLPDRIELTRVQLPGVFNPGSLAVQDFRNKVTEAEAEAYGVVMNSFEELEPRYVNGLKKVKAGKVWCIGPLSLCNNDGLDKAQRGDKASIDEKQCLKWLDSQQPGSVVYACLGSLSRPPPSQLIELCLGLEASKRPFVWAVRARERATELEKWIEEDGFEERTKGRGLIIRGWAPQLLILSHKAVGAFLTHCGWNSTLEGVCAGVPIVTWPMFAEQFLNEKLLVQVLGVGVSVGAQVVVYLCEEDKFGVLVKKEAIRRAVEEVMDGGEEGEERRERARKLGKMAKKAMEDGGSSCLNVASMIQDVLQQVNAKF